MLLHAVANLLVAHHRIQRVRTPLDLFLLMVLWILANPDTFRSTAVHFGVRPGVVHFHYCYLIEAMREMAPQYVQWPDANERAQMAYLPRKRNKKKVAGVAWRSVASTHHKKQNTRRTPVWCR